jgi:hypothetical protein
MSLIKKKFFLFLIDFKIIDKFFFVFFCLWKKLKFEKKMNKDLLQVNVLFKKFEA